MCFRVGICFFHFPLLPLPQNKIKWSTPKHAKDDSSKNNCTTILKEFVHDIQIQP